MLELCEDDSSHLTFAPARDDSYEWAFELKKATEKDYIKAIFGWDEEVQREFHAKEWQQEKPTVISLGNIKVGTYLLQRRDYGYYFARFFILPEYQGQGVGSRVLSAITKELDREHAACHLGYLQSNPRVSELYKRFGFVIYKENSAFVYMRRGRGCDTPE